MHHLLPAVGGWFQDLETGVIFEVVAVDPVQETIEVQFQDGDLDEYDLDAWDSLVLQALGEPKDWRNAFELDREDHLAAEDALPVENWSGPLSDIEPPAFPVWAES